jgi:cytochrome b
MQTGEIRVWDPFVRVCHWVLATAVIVAWFTDDPLWLHTWLGYIAVAVVLLRVIWGFIGPEQARFVSFVRGPRLVLQYLFDLMRLSSRRYLGHSPAGGAMILALLFMVAVTAITGMANLAADRGEGPLAGMISKVERSAVSSGRDGEERHEELFIKEVHETAANITLVLVLLHIAGVAFASLAHRENLVRAMITGCKRAQ